MAMGRREGERQGPLWIAGTDLPEGPGHPFYKRLSKILAEHGFDRFVEELCAGYYAEVMGRPWMLPGVYFRMLMVGYFAGIDSERGIGWRCADSLSLRGFLGYRGKDEVSEALQQIQVGKFLRNPTDCPSEFSLGLDYGGLISNRVHQLFALPASLSYGMGSPSIRKKRCRSADSFSFRFLFLGLAPAVRQLRIPRLSARAQSSSHCFVGFSLRLSAMPICA